MIKLSACAEMLYTNDEFEERIRKLKNDNINTIEFWQWSNKNLESIKKAAVKNEMTVCAFCVDSNNQDIQSMVSQTALNKKAEKMLITAVCESIEKAKYLNAKNLIITVGNRIDDLTYQQQMANVIDNLKLIKGYFESEDITLLIEPINLKERPKYLIPDANALIPVIKEVSSKNIKLLYDIYHQSMENKFDISEFKKALPYIGHIHIADCPGRHEPGTGNIDFDAIFDMLSKEAYSGYVGLEFQCRRPEAGILKEIIKKASK